MRSRRHHSAPRAGAAALLLSALLALGAAGLGCGSQDAEPAAPPTARVLQDEPRPAPTPVPRYPTQRLLDEQGELLESANELFGFRLPVGVREVSQEPGHAVLQIEVPLERLARFYMTRGYPVEEGKGAFIVRHAAHTLAEAPNADTLKDAVLYLRHKTGRVHELRFVAPLPESALKQDAPLVF